MKKILSFILVIFMLFALVACQAEPTAKPEVSETESTSAPDDEKTSSETPNNPDDSGTPNDPETQNPPAEDTSPKILLVDKGEPIYTVVSSHYNFDEAAQAMVETIRQKTDITFRVVKAADQSGVKGKKIIVGYAPSKVLKDTSVLEFCGLLSHDSGLSLHITGFADDLVVQATQRFASIDFASYVTTDENGKKTIAVPKNVLCFVDNSATYPDDTPMLMGRDLSDYRIVFPDNLTSTEKYLAKDFLEELGRNTGYCMSYTTDKNAPADYEIVFGKTNRAESISLYDGLNTGELKIKSVGNSIYVAYDNYLLADDACDMFHPLYVNNNETSFDITAAPNHTVAGMERPEGTDYRIMSSNIICAADRNGIQTFDIELNISWQDRCGIQGATFLAYMPDIIGLQEMQESFSEGVYATMYTELLKTVGHEYSFVDYYSTGEIPIASHSTPILYRHTVWQVEAQDIMYPDQFRYPMHRWQWALFSKIDNPDEKIILLNLHYPTASTLDKQMAAAEKVNAVVLELQATYENVPIFLTGDFNTTYHTDVYNRGIKDTAIVSSALLTENKNQTARIDHVFTDTSLTEVLSYRVIDDRYTKLSSDHRPVFADISLK